MFGGCRSPWGSGCENALSDHKPCGHSSALRFRVDGPAFVSAGDDFTSRGQNLFLRFRGRSVSDGALGTVYVTGWGMVVAVGRWMDLTGAYPLPLSCFPRILS